jgi:AAA family ATP:ADP antiporter
MRIVHLFKESDSAYRRSILFFIFAYFLVMFNYPLIRAASTTVFFEAFGAKSSPVAWLWAVGFLAVSISICNKLQSMFSVQKVFFVASLFSALVFLAGTLGFQSGNKVLAYAPFIWKEIYIVIQVHMLLAYANNFFKKEDFKFILGPIGAIGSIGGILGGLLTSSLSQQQGTYTVMWVGLVMVFLPALSFLMTPVLHKVGEDPKQTPLSTLDTPEVRKYVLYIAMIVALSQFIINIADFKFNLVFEATIHESGARTGYLGYLFTLINLFTFLFQFIVLPLILPRVSEKKYQLFIPLSYFICVFALIGGSGVALGAMAAIYIYFKSADYSLFSAGKEILYQPLKGPQKYGAKYLTDMLMYRFSKALIAAVLIYLQSSTILNVMMISFLCLWLILIVRLFQLHKKLF